MTELKLNLSTPVNVVVDYETRKTVPMTLKGGICVHNRNGMQIRSIPVCEKNGKLYISRWKDVTFMEDQ